MNQLSNLQAIFLGILQGITEFLPVSSSAHLILFSQLNNKVALPLFYNVALHFGTVLAILLYFVKDWAKIISSFFKVKNLNKEQIKNKNIFLNLVVGSIPAAILGFSFKSMIEKNFHNPVSLILPLAAVGLLLWLTDRSQNQKKSLYQLTMKDSFLIGLGQSLALIPGVSRSASTIIVCRLLNVTRQDSAKFSFLLGTPIMIGASLLHIKDFYLSLQLPQFYIGLISSFVVGLISIHFFLKFLIKFGFLAFAIYRLMLALVIFILFK